MLKRASVEQTLRSRRAMLYGIDYWVCDGWQDDVRRYWCLSVSLTSRLVSNFPLVMRTRTSKKEISVAEKELVNLIVGWKLLIYLIKS